jgi:hypothetical protein
MIDPFALPPLSPASTAPPRLLAFNLDELTTKHSTCKRAAEIAEAYLAAVGYPATCEGWVLFVQAAPATGALPAVPPAGPESRALFGALRHGDGYELGLVLSGALVACSRDAGEVQIVAALERAAVPGWLTVLCSDGNRNLLTFVVSPNPAHAGRFVAGGNA